MCENVKTLYVDLAHMLQVEHLVQVWDTGAGCLQVCVCEWVWVGEASPETGVHWLLSVC